MTDEYIEFNSKALKWPMSTKSSIVKYLNDRWVHRVL